MAEDPDTSAQSSSLPPQIPKRPILPIVLALAGGVVLLVMVLWSVLRAEPSLAPQPEVTASPSAPPVAPAPAPPPLAEAEPPPPPPPAASPARPAASGARSKAGNGSMPPVAGPGARDPSCEGPCKGKESSALLGALSARARQARTCYERALANDSMIGGKLEVSVTVSRSGVPCSAVAVKDELNNARVSSCVLSRFRSGKYPAPSGGCVNVAVPLNFTPGAR